VEKERRYQEQLKQYKKEQAKIAQLTATATLMHQRGTEKQHKTAFAIEKRIERMRTQDRPVGREKSLKAGFSQLDFQGDELFTLTKLSKSYGDRTLFSDVNLEVTGGERIALLGDNGTGKTTFLNILLGQDKQYSGNIHFGPSVRPGNLPQIITFEHMERTLLDTMLYEQNCTAQEARDRLGAFLFRGDDVFKEVGSLSGGERSRLKLCILMDERINFLVLDEPTNHLDIASREWMEAAVEDYGGALLFVSHDRYFINRFATRIWELKDGRITDFRGGYEAWLAKKARELELRSVLKPSAEKPKKEKPKRTGGTKLLEKKLAQTEREIAKTEEQHSALEEEMAASATDYQKLQELAAQQEELEERLAQLYQSWEELSLQMEES
jgi:ATPase subunit of ABC transporter with duplicated ATPase domains